MTPINCMPDIHALPNGTRTTLVPGCGLICHNCGTRYCFTEPLTGKLDNHEILPSGRVRYIELDRPFVCSCGYNLRGWDLPCGDDSGGLFAAIRERVYQEAK